MTTRTIATEADRELLARLIADQELPFTADITRGKRRSVEQNKLQRRWLNEIAEQWDGHTAEEIRGYCKLHIGVPILREENEAFREKYDAIIRPLPYEHKLAAMMEPLSMPVTSIMTTKQKARFLDAVYLHFTEKGVALTVPPEPGTNRESMEAA